MILEYQAKECCDDDTKTCNVVVETWERVRLERFVELWTAVSTIKTSFRRSDCRKPPPVEVVYESVLPHLQKNPHIFFVLSNIIQIL